MKQYKVTLFEVNSDGERIQYGAPLWFKNKNKAIRAAKQYAFTAGVSIALTVVDNHTNELIWDSENETVHS